MLAHGGRVTGIIPGFLSEKERMLREAHEMIVVDDMHQRKKLMFDRSDAFVALPGGIGTLEELVEQLTWAQLGRHTKPVVLVNIEGFWAPFLELLRHMRREAFIRPGHGGALRARSTAPRTCWPPSCAARRSRPRPRPKPPSPRNSDRRRSGRWPRRTWPCARRCILLLPAA